MRDIDDSGDSRNIESLLIWHFSKRKDVYLTLRATDVFGNDIIIFSSKKLSSKAKFLELGTGAGALLEYLLRNGFKADVYGVDICKELLCRGKRKFGKDLNLILADVKHLPFVSLSFDILACRNLLHHLIGHTPSVCRKNVMLSLNEAVRVLKNRGVIFINEECVKYRVQSWIVFFLTYILARLNVGIRYFGIHARVIVSFLTPKELNNILLNSYIKVLKWRSGEWMRIRRYKWTWLMGDAVFVRIIGNKETSSLSGNKGAARKELSVFNQ